MPVSPSDRPQEGDIEAEKGSLNESPSEELHSLKGIEIESRVWKKLDSRILPVVALFYLLSFLDRTNIGNARVAGLQKDLGMSNKQYSIALTVTYVPYIVSELPSNLLLKAVGPNYMLPTMLTLWGIVTTLQGIVTSYSGLLACRFFLGLLEGGMFPGLVLYLSYFYPRYKMSTRITAFFSTASLSGAFGGILAYGIIRMAGVGNRPGWSWIFILEGLFTFLFGLSSFFILPRSIEACSFLTLEEKEYANNKLLQENLYPDENKFSWKEVVEALKLPHLGLINVVFFLTGTNLFALAYFAPSIIVSLGYTAATAQLMSVPPFAVACAISMLVAYLSDRYQCRGIVAMGTCIFCTIGFAMFLGSKSASVQYGSLFFSIPGAYTSAPILAAWNSSNISPHTRRAASIALNFMMANCGGILATWLLGSLSPAPTYTEATITLLVFSNVGKAGRRKDMRREDEEPGLGNRSAWYIYSL
ncbi:major facilitator superfamily domain-containing protein [Rhodocollybia butyracea]|uniref:Major facilitator superfamily domain-containing protein n=1 Tax=Rhodocollybia butyracea TaxID=206335 RepID=A0A9P5UBX9_9AGAR|nr:major facilitator superfamily domain-containing protein [Rhodocollybia butyracea]